MTKRAFLPLLAALPLALALACGGSGAAPGRSMDVEGIDEGTSRRARREAPKPLSASQIPLLSLDGVTVPARPEDQVTGEIATAAAGAGGDQAGGGKDAPAVGEASAAPSKPLSGRNLFSFEEDPVVVAQRKAQQEEAAKQAEEMAKKAMEARKQQDEYLRLHPPPPQPPSIPFTFVGYMGPPESRIGVFSSGGAGIFLAKPGDRVQEKFRIVDIGYESAEVGFEGFKETKRIPLQGGGK